MAAAAKLMSSDFSQIVTVGFSVQTAGEWRASIRAIVILFVSSNCQIVKDKGQCRSAKRKLPNVRDQVCV